MADGRYSSKHMNFDKISDWVDKGGTLLLFRRAIDAGIKQGWIEGMQTVKSNSLLDNTVGYSNLKNAKDAQKIGGAIFSADINTDHPLFFGYSQKSLPVFKRGTQFYTSEKESSVAMKYSQEPLLSGYCSDMNVEKARSKASVVCARKGAGTIIACVDNPNFRAYWLGGSKFFSNLLHMSHLINDDSKLD